jgi:hypothetical protein
MPDPFLKPFCSYVCTQAQTGAKIDGLSADDVQENVETKKENLKASV